MGKFKFNGILSEDFGLVIQTPPTYVYPERDLTSSHIPGRNGDVIIDNNSYKNVERTYLIAKAFMKGTTYYSNFQVILDWLNSAKGSYARLEDSYDDEVYRLASFQISGSFANHLDQAGSAEVKFVCKPQRYLKSGENEIKYLGSSLQIENQTGYPALPDMIIKNIDTGDYGVLMMSVIDKLGNAVSSISFTNYVGNLVLNSEDQTAYDLNNEDKYSVISLNGKVFPVLNPGISTIEFKKYEIETSGIIDTYSSLLAVNQKSCVSEYKTYSAIESSMQSKVLIKSYDKIIDLNKSSYLASSVQTHISSKSEVYKFESFNSLMSQYAKLFQFTGSLSDNTSEKPDWLIFDGNSIKANETGFFIVNNEDKRIRFIKKNDVIIGTVNTNAVNSIYYYKAATETEIPITGIAIDPPNVGSNYYWLEIEYTSKPSWISFSVEYDDAGSPSKIHYKRAANGYYWTDKTWIFGKAQWTYYTGATYETFASLYWNTSKKAFVSNEGLSLSTSMTFTYKYINCTPTTLSEYDPVIEKQTNEDTGITVDNVLNAVHFTIKDSGTDLNTIAIYSKESGYYSIKAESSSSATTWQQFPANTAILTTLKGTDGFEVFYLETIPDYTDQNNFPEWLNPIPVKTGDNPLAPTKIQFQVNKKAYYRISSGTEDEVGGSESWGTVKEVDDIISDKLSSDYYYIYMIETIPTVYPINRCYTYKLSGTDTTSENPPSWITVEAIGTMESGSSTPKTLKYKVGAAGYYKWDSNSTWIKKETANINDVLFESTGKDDSTIYYLEVLPEYSAFDLSNLLSIIVKQDSAGNPIEITYKVLETGYYRFNNSTDWNYILSGTTLLVSKINESNRIYHLKELNDSLDSLEINIKPRWWML